MGLTPEQIAIVKSTVPILQQHGETITRTFYGNMLSAHPELKNIFSLRNQSTGAQQRALANSVLAYATYIDDLPRLTHAVERIAHKHASLFVKPEQYAIVGEHLVGAFAQVLGDGLTPPVAEAWIAAYQQLADVFIAREGQLYKEVGPEWQDWRKFTIAKREDVSEGVVSLYLKPVDGGRLPSFVPGQYVSLQIPIPELDNLNQSRQYSLSSGPSADMDCYRVTIKREPGEVANPTPEQLAAGGVPGVVGNRLHDSYKVGDEVELSPPRGEFTFDATNTPAEAPVVLLSAGVGATPMISILDSILSKSSSSGRKVTWAHAARHSGAVCYGRYVRSAAAEANGTVVDRVFLDSVAEGDEKGVDYDYSGEFDLAKLGDEGVLHLGEQQAEYFLCGPQAWMIKVRDDLFNKGVAADKVHLELFATGDV
ncbi:hypothetical protein K4F52_004476 [Lecanicillium sp. MT-2017a]|nr:hypothetical protein K4F52_004476 [Lecanicillium sp. MT-2017a]